MRPDFSALLLNPAGSTTATLSGEMRTRLFSSVLDVLNSEDVSYCLLSGYEQGGDEADSDVDFMVHPRDAGRLPALLQTASARLRGSLVQALQHETTACYFVIARQDGDCIAFLNPDCALDYRTHGRLRLRADSVLKKRRPYGNLFRPAVEDEFLYYLIKKIVKASIDSTHVARLRNLFRANPFACHTGMLKFWSGNSACLIEQASINHDLHWFKAHLPDLLSELELSPYNESFLSRIANKFRTLMRVVARVNRPTGLSVVIMGGVQSQREALAEGLATALAPAFRHSRVQLVEHPTNSGSLSWIRHLIGAAVGSRMVRIRSTLSVAILRDGAPGTAGARDANSLGPARRLAMTFLPVDLVLTLAPADATRRTTSLISLNSRLSIARLTQAAASAVLGYLSHRVAKRFNLGGRRQVSSSQTYVGLAIDANSARVREGD